MIDDDRWSDMTFDQVFDVVVEAVRDLEAARRRDTFAAIRPRRGPGMRALADKFAPIVQVPAWMLAGEDSPEAYQAALHRDRNPAPVRLPQAMRITAETFELLTTGEPWPVEQVATVQAGNLGGWYTITAGDRVLAVVVPKGRHTSRVTFVPPRLFIDGIELAVPGRSEPRAPQGAKRRRAW